MLSGAKKGIFNDMVRFERVRVHSIQTTRRCACGISLCAYLNIVMDYTSTKVREQIHDH